MGATEALETSICRSSPPTRRSRSATRCAASARASAGPSTTARIVEADEPPTELWDALAEKGYLGVNLPERYGGGGLGMHALQMVGEEISAAGCSLLLIVVSPAIVGSILTRHGTEAQREQLAARDRRRARRRSRSRSPSPTPAPTRTTSRPPRPATATATACAARRPTSPGSRTPTRSWSSPASARTTARSACRC